MKAKLLLADDHDLVRDALIAYLEREPGIEVKPAADFHQAARLMRNEGPFDLVLLDYNMPGMDGLTGLSLSLEMNAGNPVALLSGAMTRELSEEVLSLGAIGTLTKTMEAKSLVNAIKFMLAGEVYAPSHLLKSHAEGQANNSEGKALSNREMEVLSGLHGGLSNKEIARTLELQEVTIKLHVRNLCKKLAARNRTHVAIIAKESGFI